VALNKYYQDELAFLRELGQEFAREHPRLTRYLSDRSKDPDVERLLEGFAFLSGRLREKLDDELPELTHSLIQLLWPHYLRPVPAATMIEFTPIDHAITEKQPIPRGTALSSIPIDGTRCNFRTCYNVMLYPIRIAEVDLDRTASAAHLRMDIEMAGGTTVDKLELDDLRIHLHGEPHISQILYLWIRCYLTSITVHPENGKNFSILPDKIKPVGFSHEESLLDYPANSFTGYRYLQEYFNFPEKFLFLDIGGFEALKNSPESERFSLVFHFNRTLSPQVRVQARHIRLHCTPAVNLFTQDADPIRLDQRRIEYRVRPSSRNQGHYHVYSINNVEGWVPGSGQRRPYAPFESFDHVIERANHREELYYRTRVRQAVNGRGLDHYISFVNAGEQTEHPNTETISLALTCTNANLPERLRVGDIDTATGESPPFTKFSNITAPTASVSPPLDGGLHWLLISNMSLNYLSLANPDALKTILSAYDFHAFFDQQAERAGQQRLEGIDGLDVKRVDVLQQGLPVRGLRTHMRMLESKFTSEGDMYLFATVLSEFFALYASINSFHELEVTGVENGEFYSWPLTIGQQPIL